MARLLLALTVALLTAAALVSAWPYRSSVAGIRFVASASVTPSRRGVTMDTSLGSVQFRDVTSVPVGLHLTPRIDLTAVRAATAEGSAFTDRAQSDLESQAAPMLVHFTALAVVGLLVGALTGLLVVDGLVAVVTGDAAGPASRRRRLTGTGVIVLGVTAAVAIATAATAVLTYRSDWYTRYSVTGVLADIAATPARLSALDARDSRTADKIRAVISLQDALTRPPPAKAAPPTAFRIMFISDVHRRDIYPYLEQYVDANDVRLIINTGDETLFGSTAELTPDYLASIRTLTAATPMVWVKGTTTRQAWHERWLPSRGLPC